MIPILGCDIVNGITINAHSHGPSFFGTSKAMPEQGLTHSLM